MDIKTAKVLGAKYKIVTKIPKKEIDPEYLKGLDGLCNCKAKKIWINPELKGGEKVRTILHEIGHATLERNGMHYTDLLDPNTEEIIVETMATSGYDFWADRLKELLKIDEITDIKDRIQSLL
jgi:Zn-dependent peptidase ImmA (M78 family)